ncbi:peptide chain release factor N(5)-glutamine methyltransferase [Staphylococcus gallinarum]|uniref:Release factor glutamine methyltransferase n=1 Tax=Staphylococcus gallinarum TaxID=1293 RepID=A0A3A0VLK1_STAGA|nr:peptide chain release factor N(5)-glutamine methyltransferase [Staphylococcus gallinarum]RIP32903.1 peptide chain release factor N(5)-glutamine methyltransferase [Staphylococcus gallinarum]
MVSFKSALDCAKSECIELNIETTRIEWLMMDLFQWTKVDFIVHMNDEMTSAQSQQFDVAKSRMLNGEPIQYIVGYQSFYGERFKVNNDCLIPRPETEEVMLHFLEKLNRDDTIVDIGTGSGNIPIMLKKLNTSLKIYATDISNKALLVAKENARQHQVDIKFLEGDALQPLIEQGIKVNGLISNPPYIDRADATFMEDTVLSYEPHSALFANDHGYRVYHDILANLPKVLKPNAQVVFEIGYNQGEILKNKIQTMYPDLMVSIVQDINNNDRIISFKWHD